MTPRLLNVGCGDWTLPGFLNLDREGRPDVRLDAALSLPFRAGSVDGIYCEHFIEHLSQADGAAFLRECRRVLRPRGVLRIATPDLDGLVRDYASPGWRSPEWDRHGYDWLATRCEMLNLALREWGHRWVYNEEELVRLARLAGLTPRGRYEPGQSDEAAFRGLEHRGGAHLIMEFVKDGEPDLRPDPLVSVVIPAYKPRHFRAALESARAQTYRNLEIVVGDDSPDGAIGRIVAEAAAGDARIVYVRNAPALGELDNARRGLELARGDYVKFLYDDDLLHPTCIERQVAWLQRRPDATLVTSHRGLVDGEDRPLPEDDVTRRPVTRDAIIDGVSAANAVLALLRNFIGEPSTVMFRRRDVLQIEPDLWCFAGRRAEVNADVTLWLSLLSRGDLVYLTDTLSVFRRHPEQQQRQAGFLERASRSWERLRFDAGRLGFLRPQGPWRLLARPLEAHAPEPARLTPGAAGWVERLAQAVHRTQACLARGDVAGAERLIVHALELADRERDGLAGAGDELAAVERLLRAAREAVAEARRPSAPAPAAASPSPPAREVPPPSPADVPPAGPARAAATPGGSAVEPPITSIVVRTHASPDLLQGCLAALDASGPSGAAEVIVVDDGSTDGTAELLRREAGAGRIRVVTTGEYLGPARAFNLGARRAQGRYLVFLHDDVLPQGGWLDALRSVAEADPAVGVVGAKLLHPGTLQVQHAGLAFGPTRTPYAIYEGWNADHPAVDHQRDFRALSGACLLVRREQFLALGGFDEGYPGGYEDVDLCLRYGKAGARVVYAPGAVLEHHAREPVPADPRHADDARIGTRRLLERWGHTLRADAPRYHAEDGIEVVAAGDGVQFLLEPGRVHTSVVLVTYNSALDLTDCLRTLYDFRNTGEPFELVVVDNASTDRTRELLAMLRAKVPGVTVILNDENRGFARAVNQGIRASSGRWVVLLNPDTRLTRGWLARLRAHAGPGVGAIGPVSNAAAGDQHVQLYIPEWDGHSEAETAGLLQQRQAGRGVETRFLTFFCTLLPRAVLDAVGLLDEDFFLNQEDMEYCLRLRLAGYRLLVAADAYVHHLGGGSKLTLDPTTQLRLQFESMQVLYGKLEQRFGKGRVPPLEELWGKAVVGASPTASRG